MASVVIAGDVSGTCTLQAANAAGTTVLSLPTTSGTLVATGGAPSFTTVTTGLGNASAPSITFTGDTNTGIFSPGADTIAFAEGGSEIARFDANGSLLVGQTTTAVETGSIVTAKNLEITRTVDSDGAALGQLSWVNNTNAGSGSGTSFVKDVACIKGIMDGTGNNSGGYITFETKADAGSRAERMRINSAGNVQLSTANTSILNNSGRPILNQTGSILQVVSTTLTTLVTASADTWTTITSASITPSSTSSRILVFYNMPVATVGQETISRVLRGSTVITEYSGGDITQIGWGFIGAGSAGWTGGMMSGSFRDSPSITSSITYNLQAYQQGTTLYVNRTSGTTSTDSAGGVTTITLMEIAA